MAAAFFIHCYVRLLLARLLAAKPCGVDGWGINGCLHMSEVGAVGHIASWSLQGEERVVIGDLGNQAIKPQVHLV